MSSSVDSCTRTHAVVASWHATHVAARYFRQRVLHGCRDCLEKQESLDSWGEVRPEPLRIIEGESFIGLMSALELLDPGILTTRILAAAGVGRIH